MVGGSIEYTGAPYYAAMASLRAGCDLSFVVCPQDALIPIKSYSPELIVYSWMGSETFSAKEGAQLKIARAFVVGPGLGRHE